jgi:molecular chaperone DnaK (HSP70)
VGFQKGYNTSYEETVSEYQPTPLEKLQESNWYVDPKTLLKSNWEPKPQNEKEVDQGLRDAMKTAKADGVFDKPKPEPETLTLKNLLKKWEVNFSAKWKNPKNKTSELYEEEVERFIQMFEEWMPDVIRDVQDDWDDGYNSYRNTLMRKLK